MSNAIPVHGATGQNVTVIASRPESETKTSRLKKLRIEIVENYAFTMSKMTLMKTLKCVQLIEIDQNETKIQDYWAAHQHIRAHFPMLYGLPSKLLTNFIPTLRSGFNIERACQ